MVDISALSIICIFVSALISVCFPFVFLIIGKKKLKGSFLPFLFSVFVYFIVFIVQALIWSALNMDELLIKILGTENSDAVITSIRCVFMALLETGGLWLYFRICRKRWTLPGNALTFGSGYAVCACLTYSVMLVMSALVVIANASGKEVTYTFSQLYVNNAILGREDVEFLYYGLRSLFDAMFYLSAAMLFFTALHNELIWPLPLVFILNILHSIPALLGQLHVWYWANSILAMIAIGIVAIITSLVAYKVYLDHYKKK